MLRSSSTIGFLLIAAPVLAQTTWYVDAAAIGPGDGSLAAPFPTIQAALAVAGENDVVSVGPGQYFRTITLAVAGIVVEGREGPHATRLTAPGSTGTQAVKIEANTSATRRGFTIHDTSTGIRIMNGSPIVTIERCAVVDNDIGLYLGGGSIRHCTVVGNGMGVYQVGPQNGNVFDSVVWGNGSDYENGGTPFSGVYFHRCIGPDTDSWLAQLDDCLLANPKLWAPEHGFFQPKPASPCIDYAGPDDAGAFEFDPDFGADFDDLGSALPGSTSPTLFGTGAMIPGEIVRLHVASGPPSAPTWVVIGANAAHVPLFGGTLVPAPDVLVPTVLDANGARMTVFTWPAGVPSGVPLFAQAWVLDAGAPQFRAATNGLALTPP